MKHFANLSALKDSISNARACAISDAREEGRYTPSRGTFLATASKGLQCSPRPSADCPTWDGTMKEIDELVARVVRDHPDVDEITIGGGYDAADSMVAHQNGDYCPWAGVWEITVWERDYVDHPNNPDGSSYGADYATMPNGEQC